MKALYLSLLCFFFVSGCIGSRDVEAPVAYLSAAGWQDNQALLKESSFDGYASSVKDEVQRYRIPFNPVSATDEIEQASPVELAPAGECAGRVAGIAILVHGLSDTAYSMRDIGEVLASGCFKSRIMLLPGHGTRAGDLLTTRLSHWHNSIDYLVDQAVSETDTVVLVGFSLGGVLTLDTALRRHEVIDGVIGISPAYHLSSAKLARWAPVLAPVMRWVDRGVADDPMRYEAMPMRGVAETWRAMQQLKKNIEQSGSVDIPWLLVQSMDDAVVVPEQNEQLWELNAVHPHSRLIRFVSDQEYSDNEKTLTLQGGDEAQRVIALNHLAIHQSPENSLYGLNGSYRNCGGNMPRDRDMVTLCEQSEEVWYGLWDTQPAPGQALAYSTFNPSFDKLAEEINRFVTRIVNDE